LTTMGHGGQEVEPRAGSIYEETPNDQYQRFDVGDSGGGIVC